jgi:heterotetrameric sarcosine oxidase gamma subunit
VPKRFEIVSRSIVELSAWPDAEQELEAHVSKAKSSGDTVLDIAPRRYWLIDGQAPAEGGFAVTDLSHGYQCLRLSGADRFEVLAGGLPIDIDPVSFPVGAVATSAIETITVTVHNRGDAFDIYCNRSYAGSLAEWIKSAVCD